MSKEGKNITISFCESNAVKVVNLLKNYLCEDCLRRLESSLAKEIESQIKIIVKDVNEACTLTSRDEQRAIEIDKRRKDFLGRVLIRQIEDYLPPHNDEALALKLQHEYVHGKIPRDIIPALLDTIRAMFGQEALEEKEGMVKEIIMRYRSESGRIAWEDFYNDDSIKKIVVEALSKVKKELSDAHRRDWFIQRINNYLSLYCPKMNRAFGEDDYGQLTSALFRCVKEDG